MKFLDCSITGDDLEVVLLLLMHEEAHSLKELCVQGLQALFSHLLRDNQGNVVLEGALGDHLRIHPKISQHSKALGKDLVRPRREDG